MGHLTDSDTIVAIATPPGRGGVGVVRISGSCAEGTAQAICGKLLAPRVATLCNFRDSAGELLDSGLALYFPGPASYTGEDTLELHGHGSPFQLNALVTACIAQGNGRVRVAQPGEFTQRAFLNGKLDLAQAEAVADVIDAGSHAAARAAVRALSGAFSAHVKTLQDKVIRLRMFTEATLDFPEEDVDFLQAEKAREQCLDAITALDAVLAQARQGQLLHDGIRIVLAGAPNVGKSSLLNRLAGDDVAIVTPIAGTTRDTVRAHISLAGLPCEIIDTAGIRETDDPIERIGIERSHAAIASADVVLVLSAFDAVDPSNASATATTNALAPKVQNALPTHVSTLFVENKCDLHRQNVTPTENKNSPIRVSAHTGEGIAALVAQISAAVGYAGEHPTTFSARARHVEAITEARAHLDRALAHLQTPALELFAEELRLAHSALGVILGEFTADDLLGEIFGKFCIGK